MSNHKLYTSADRKADYWKRRQFNRANSKSNYREAIRQLTGAFGRPVTKPTAQAPPQSKQDFETSTPDG